MRIKNNKVMVGFIAFVLLLIPTLHTTKVWAEDKPKNQAGGFSISAGIPENQKNKDLSYFDLSVKPGQKQDLVVKIKNSADKETTFITEVNQAVTSDGGAIDYSDAKAKADKSLPFDFRDIAKVDEKEVTVPANSEKTFVIHLQVPNEPFDGIALGGIYVYKKDGETKTTTNDKGFQIRNNFAYSIAISLRENDTVVSPNMKLNKVQPKIQNAHPIIAATLQNPTPVVIGKMEVHAKIYKEGQEKVYIDNTSQQLQMAPNSNFAYGIGLDGHRLKPGKYKLDMTVNSKNNKWHFTKDFTITKKQAEDINANSVFEEEEKKGIDWLLVALIAVVSILFIVILILVLRNLKKNKEKRARRDRHKKK